MKLKFEQWLLIKLKLSIKVTVLTSSAAGKEYSAIFSRPWSTSEGYKVKSTISNNNNDYLIISSSGIEFFFFSPAPIAMKSPTFHANLSVVNDTKKKVGFWSKPSYKIKSANIKRLELILLKTSWRIFSRRKTWMRWEKRKREKKSQKVPTKTLTKTKTKSQKAPTCRRLVWRTAVAKGKLCSRRWRRIMLNNKWKLYQFRGNKYHED